MSGVTTGARGRVKPDLSSAAAPGAVPYSLSNASNAALLHTTKRPTWLPGASGSRFNRDTSQISTPDKLRNARALSPSTRLSVTSSGPRRIE